MVEVQSLWQRLVAPENLWLAYRNARKGKARRPDVARFTLDLENELLTLRQALRAGDYRPGGYRQFYVHDRKRRLISAAPFRDRVVHHALMQTVNPLLEAQFCDHSWACRTGKGTHAAVAQYQIWARRYAYALKMDIAEYFASIDRRRLLEKLESMIADERVLSLIALIVASGQGDKGLPLGNLTSQIFGNLYLNDLDHYITDTLGFKAYLRYVDDMVILSDDKSSLWSALAAIQQKLAEDSLKLHPRKVYVTPTAAGLDVLGYRVYPRHRLLRHENGYRFMRRMQGAIRAYQRGERNLDELEAQLKSWLGHALHADSHGLRKTLFSRIVVTGMPEHAVVARRWLEQQTVEPSLRQPQQEPAR